MPRKRNPISDITLHFKRRDGKPVSDKEARAALWAAHKIAQKPGGNVETDMREWVIEGIDWKAGPREYHYGPGKITEVIGNMGGILESIGLDGVRAGKRGKRPL